MTTEKRPVFFMDTDRSCWYEIHNQNLKRTPLKLLDLPPIAENEDVVIFVTPTVTAYQNWNYFLGYLIKKIPPERKISLATNDSVFTRYLKNLFQE
jgi:hypothetical protein